MRRRNSVEDSGRSSAIGNRAKPPCAACARSPGGNQRSDAGDDAAVPVGNSLGFYAALHRAGVPAELHVFPYGGHGFGTRGIAGLGAAAWPRLARDWIAAQAPERAP